MIRDGGDTGMLFLHTRPHGGLVGRIEGGWCVTVVKVSASDLDTSGHELAELASGHKSTSGHQGASGHKSMSKHEGASRRNVSGLAGSSPCIL